VQSLHQHRLSACCSFQTAERCATAGDWVILTESGTFENNRLKMESDSRELIIWIYFTPRDVLRRAGVSDLLEFAEYDYSLYEASKTQPFNPDRAILQRIGVSQSSSTPSNTLTLTYRSTSLCSIG
jgi:hypothetical protein